MIKMFCKKTGKEENQIIVKSRDEGLDLKCSGCGKLHSHEIGYFAEYYKEVRARTLDNAIGDLWNMFFILSFVTLPHERFNPSSSNPLTAIPYNHFSRKHMECINCGKKFDLTRHDKCPHCGKSYPYYTREEWEQAQK